MFLFKKMGANEYHERGLKKQKNNEIKGAKDDFTKAISINPKFAEAYFGRATCWQREDNFDRAIADYTKSINLAGTYAAAYVNRGVCWQSKGDHIQAIQDFDRAIEIKPEDFGAFHNRGISKQHIKDYKGSICDFNCAIEIYPNDALSYYGRCGSWSYIGEFERALEDIEEALRIKPNFGHFKTMAEYLRKKVPGIQKILKVDLGEDGVGAIITRNSSIEEKYPGGFISFKNNYNPDSDDYLSVTYHKEGRDLKEVYIQLRKSGFERDIDFVVFSFEEYITEASWLKQEWTSEGLSVKYLPEANEKK